MPSVTTALRNVLPSCTMAATTTESAELRRSWCTKLRSILMLSMG